MLININIIIGESVFECFKIETSGMENTIKNWQVGDKVRVEGKISFIMSNEVYLLNFYPSGNSISVKKEN